ncbi:hypothetical protein HGRIS_000190 [Hohenbuehelia grisea]|uniref:Uncharacterized protein n=1 Tax=Hohenbuehelia grisea TaxID=104357 RepID=A0ABR3JSE3_9AGAR
MRFQALVVLLCSIQGALVLAGKPKLTVLGAKGCKCGQGRTSRTYGMLTVKDTIAMTSKPYEFKGNTYPHGFSNIEQLHTFVKIDDRLPEKLNEDIKVPPEPHADCVKPGTADLEIIPMIKPNGVPHDLDRIIRTRTGRFCGCVSHPPNTKPNDTKYNSFVECGFVDE